MSEEKKVVAQEAKTEVSEVKNTVDEAVITEQAVASMLATVGAEAKTSQPKADEGKPRQTKGTLLRRLGGPEISGAIEEAIAQQVNEAISIMDSHGNAVCYYRMEGAMLIASELAPTKAYTAVAMKRETSALQGAIQPGRPLYQLGTMVQRPVTAIGGGFPIVKNGVFLGGLGISGGTTAQDMAVGHGALRAAGLEQ